MVNRNKGFFYVLYDIKKTNHKDSYKNEDTKYSTPTPQEQPQREKVRYFHLILEGGLRASEILVLVVVEGVDVALGFDMTRWLAIELAYAGEWRDSTFATFDYDDNRVSLSAKAAF